MKDPRRRRRLGARLLLVLPAAFAIFLSLGTPLADAGPQVEPEGQEQTPPAEKKVYPPGFEPIAAARAEQVDANKIVVAAYAAFFFGLFGYVIYVVRRQTEMAKEITRIGERLDGKK